MADPRITTEIINIQNLIVELALSGALTDSAIQSFSAAGIKPPSNEIEAAELFKSACAQLVQDVLEARSKGKSLTPAQSKFLELMYRFTYLLKLHAKNG